MTVYVSFQLVYEMPPRVYIPHDSSPIVFSDYMFKDEQLEDCAIRAQQLLGVDGLDCESINSRTERTAGQLALLLDVINSIGGALLLCHWSGQFLKV